MREFRDCWRCALAFTSTLGSANSKTIACSVPAVGDVRPVNFIRFPLLVVRAGADRISDATDNFAPVDPVDSSDVHEVVESESLRVGEVQERERADRVGMDAGDDQRGLGDGGGEHDLAALGRRRDGGPLADRQRPG